MRKLKDSDMFEITNKSSNFTPKMAKILAGDASVQILNLKLTDHLNRLKRAYKDKATIAAIDEIMNGNLILFYTANPELRLSTALPFFEYKKSGVKKVAINLSNYTSISNAGKENEEIDIDLKKLYCLIIPALYLLRVLDEKTVLPTIVASSCAYMWSTMFNKILIKAIGLSSNTDRLNAFRYFAMKFFMVYYLDIPEALAENSAISFLPNKSKNYLINKVESETELDGVNIYGSFASFCGVLFNNKYTGIRNIKGSKGIGAADSMNVSLYIKKFVNQYDFSSILSLAAFPYFIFIMFEAYNWAYMCNDKALEDVFRLDEKLTLQVFTELNRMI